MNAFISWLYLLLGLGIEPKELTFAQTTCRGILVFFAALVVVRLSDRRALTKKSPFDVVLLVVLASILARAINGSAAFFPTLGATTVVVALHRLLAFVSCRWPGVALVIKGRPFILVRNGSFQRRAMNLNHVSEADIEEDLRLNVQKEEISEVKVARLEASGDISFITKPE